MFSPQEDKVSEEAYIHLSQEEREKYDSWFAPKMQKYFTPPTLPFYHYTTGTNLIEIIRSGELWATQLACLNDASEFQYQIQMFKNLVENKLSDEKLAPERDLLHRIRHGLENTNVAIEGLFVTSFSEDGDDLNQWRAYGKGEGGYAIQFDSHFLRTCRIKTFLIGKIVYDQNEQLEFFKDTLNSILRFFTEGAYTKGASSPQWHIDKSLEKWTIDFLKYWAIHLRPITPLFKHPGFAGEKEWRLLYFLEDDGISRQRYLQRDSMMTQHVPLRIRRLEPPNLLPITGIVVGPSRHKDISKTSVGSLLRTHNYPFKDIPITDTAIPYRSV